MRTLQISLVTVLVLSLFSFKNSDQPILNYIDQYNVIAVQEMNRTGIPASITLAQGIIESKYGESSLAKKANNHFGIKCNNNWTGGEFYLKDDDFVNGKLIKSCFRTYANAEASYYDHSEFLMVNKRYAFLFELKKTDYKGWAKGLKKAGYATATHYANTLINTIEKFELYKYDQESTSLLALQREKESIPQIKEAQTSPHEFKPATTASIYAETLVAEAPPKPTALPTNYRPGDGLKKLTKQRKWTFEEDVFLGGKSSKYLDEITPQIVARD